jgi:hypothetical protein
MPLDHELLEALLEMVRAFCAQRNLIADAYIDGMTSGPALDHDTIARLTKYHREWMR